MFKKAVLAVLLAFGAASLITACEQDGPAEEAGEKIDNAMEKAGDKMEHAGDKMEEKAEDAKN